MAVYLIVPLMKNADALGAAVERAIEPLDRYPLANDAGWLVVFPGTTVELSNAIGITGQPEGTAPHVGSAIVSPVTSYYGRGSPEMWEWIKTRLERSA